MNDILKRKIEVKKQEKKKFLKIFSIKNVWGEEVEKQCYN